MLTVVPAEGPLLERVLDATYATLHQGLSRHAFAQLDEAQRRTAWARDHQRRFALMRGTAVLASAQRYDLSGTFDGQRVSVCGIGEVCTDFARHGDAHSRVLVDRLVDAARQSGADLAILFTTSAEAACAPEGFEVLPTVDLELKVTESTRYGAPMTLVRGGEDRDLAAIISMGATRASSCRWHLDRDIDFVKYAITRKRLLAGLGPAGARQLDFVIAEEGITAAAYIVLSVADRTWTIEECGDRDPSGARVGALLQALVAREPAERRPSIVGWLPPGFLPPQAHVVSEKPSAHILLGRRLSAPQKPLGLSREDVLYWRSDFF